MRNLLLLLLVVVVLVLVISRFRRGRRGAQDNNIEDGHGANGPQSEKSVVPWVLAILCLGGALAVGIFMALGPAFSAGD